MRIQVQIQETLLRQYSHHPSVKNAISQLDSELMDITKVTCYTRIGLKVFVFTVNAGCLQAWLVCLFVVQLYGEFADHFKLSECKLAIIHCAGHSDPILVHSLWQEILEKGENISILQEVALFLLCLRVCFVFQSWRTAWP